MASYLRYRTDNADLEQVQDSVEKKFGDLDALVILNGKLLRDVEITNNVTNKIYHGLGRPYQGYIVTKINEKVVVKVIPADDTEPDKFIPLSVVSYDAVADLWVF